MNFKIGDKVRCIKDSDHYPSYNLPMDRIYVVEYVYRDNNYINLFSQPQKGYNINRFVLVEGNTELSTKEKVINKIQEMESRR